MNDQEALFRSTLCNIAQRYDRMPFSDMKIHDEIICTDLEMAGFLRKEEAWGYYEFVEEMRHG